MRTVHEFHWCPSAAEGPVVVSLPDGWIRLTVIPGDRRLVTGRLDDGPVLALVTAVQFGQPTVTVQLHTLVSSDPIPDDAFHVGSTLLAHDSLRHVFATYMPGVKA